MSEKIKTHRDLIVFQKAYSLAKEIFEISKSFPDDERYSLTDQVRRSSRSVAANLAEAFRKRRYPKHFISKLSDCESEAAETQVWLDFARDFNYLDSETNTRMNEEYEIIISMMVKMASKPENWKW